MQLYRREHFYYGNKSFNLLYLNSKLFNLRTFYKVMEFLPFSNVKKQPVDSSDKSFTISLLSQE